MNNTNLQGLMILIFLPFSIRCRALSLPSLGFPPPPQPMIPAPMTRHSTSWAVSSHSPSPVNSGRGRRAASSLARSSAELLGQYLLFLACSCSLTIYSDATYTEVHDTPTLSKIYTLSFTLVVGAMSSSLTILALPCHNFVKVVSYLELYVDHDIKIVGCG